MILTVTDSTVLYCIAKYRINERFGARAALSAAQDHIDPRNFPHPTGQT